MAIRKNTEPGFVDAMLEGSTRTAGLLERLDAATPWRELAAPILTLPEYTNAGGRSAQTKGRSIEKNAGDGLKFRGFLSPVGVPCCVDEFNYDPSTCSCGFKCKKDCEPAVIPGD